MEERLYPETIEYNRSPQELRNWKVYGRQQIDDIKLNASIIKHSLEDATISYFFSIQKGLDCNVLYNKVLKAGMEALINVRPEEEQDIRNCMLCMVNNTPISQQQLKQIFQMLEKEGDNLLFIMEYLEIAGMDTFDVRPRYWMEPLSDEFHYNYTLQDCLKAGCKLFS